KRAGGDFDDVTWVEVGEHHAAGGLDGGHLALELCHQQIGHDSGLAAKLQQANRGRQPAQPVDADDHQIEVHEQVAGEIGLFACRARVDRVNLHRRKKYFQALAAELIVHKTLAARFGADDVPLAAHNLITRAAPGLPFKALRVSTTSRALARTLSQSKLEWSVAMTTQCAARRL